MPVGRSRGVSYGKGESQRKQDDLKKKREKKKRKRKRNYWVTWHYVNPSIVVEVTDIFFIIITHFLCLWSLVWLEHLSTMSSKSFFPEKRWRGMRVDLGNQHESSTWELGDKLSEEIHQKSETRYHQNPFPSVAHGIFRCRNVNSHEQARMRIFMQFVSHY